MIVTYNPRGINNFHNQPALRLRITGETAIGMGENPVYIVTKRQARKVEKHFCGVTDCHCPAGGIEQLDADGNEWAIYPKNCE